MISPTIDAVFDWCVKKKREKMKHNESCMLHVAYFAYRHTDEDYRLAITGYDIQRQIIYCEYSEQMLVTYPAVMFNDINVEENRYYKLLLKAYLEENPYKYDDKEEDIPF